MANHGCRPGNTFNRGCVLAEFIHRWRSTGERVASQTSLSMRNSVETCANRLATWANFGRAIKAARKRSHGQHEMMGKLWSSYALAGNSKIMGQLWSSYDQEVRPRPLGNCRVVELILESRRIREADVYEKAARKLKRTISKRGLPSRSRLRKAAHPNFKIVELIQESRRLREVDVCEKATRKLKPIISNREAASQSRLQKMDLQSVN